MRIFFEHEALPALEGETVAAALTAAGILGLRRTREGAMRGAFCGMGVCFDCLVCIDGLPNQRACMTKVRAGMKVFPQAHVPALPPLPDSSLPDAPHQEVAERPCAILVVGAGPAGLAAAQAAAERGAKVTLLDERPEAGGQYYKQLAPSHRFAAGARKDRQFARGQALLDRVRNLGVAILNEATVWDAYAAVTEDGRTKLEIAMVAGGRAAIYTPQQLIVAAGAYERPFPVPGWTLPGVMTTGAAQTLSRAYRVSPGSRVLIAGNGPLNFQVACELARSGVEVVAIAETARRLGSSRLRSGLTAVLLSPGLIWEGLGYLKELHRHKIPVLYRHRLLEVTGKERAQQAIVVAVDEQGRQVSGIERAFSVDAVCMGYGFLPSTEITRLLGCSHRYEPGLGTLVVDCGENGATSRPGVYAVGDCRAIGGSQVALAQGTLAGLAAAEAIGLPAESGSTRRAARYLSRHRAFQRALWSLFEGPAFDEFSGRRRCADLPLRECQGGRSAPSSCDGGRRHRVRKAGYSRRNGQVPGPLLRPLPGAHVRPKGRERHRRIRVFRASFPT